MSYKSEFEAENQKIVDNKNLSVEGKHKQIAELLNSYESMAQEKARTLRRNGIMEALRLKDAQAKQADYLKAQREAMDYSRLNYEAQAIKSKLARAEALSDVFQIWNEAKESGDPHVLKAWKDTAAEVIQGIEGPDQIRDRIYKEIDQVQIESPDPEIAEKEREHLDKMREIESEVKDLDGFMSREKSGYAPEKVKRYVLKGIGFNDNDQVQTDFDYERNDKMLSGRLELPDEVATRVMAAEDESRERVAKIAKDQFGIEVWH